MKVRVDKIEKKYKTNGSSIPILEDISLYINEGEFVCLLGPSGCGKSTLLNILAGLIEPTGGSAHVDGKRISGPGADRVVVFQEPALFPWLTVFGNVEFGLKVAGLSKEERRERALKYLKMVHLGRFVNAYPHELSGGMKQRVALARALAMEPGILLMDEPFGSLDAQTRSILQGELQQIWEKTNKTIFFVTHNLYEAVYLADRVLVMTARPGRIKKEYNVNLPRPRKETDLNLFFTENKILSSLEEEIEKVAKEELDIDYIYTKDGILVPVDRDLGSNI